MDRYHGTERDIKQVRIPAPLEKLVERCQLPYVFKIGMGILFGGSVVTIYNSTENPIYAEIVIIGVVAAFLVAAIRRYYRMGDEQDSHEPHEPF